MKSRGLSQARYANFTEIHAKFDKFFTKTLDRKFVFQYNSSIMGENSSGLGSTLSRLQAQVNSGASRLLALS
jgi:hypothetical protein